MPKPEVILEIQENPYFECPLCGYQDYMGNTEVCPICDQKDDEEQDLCYFIDMKRKLCRQDGKACIYAEKKTWDECPKLEGFGSKG